MKIATWNLERLSRNRNDEILSKIYEINADIFILTETSKVIKLEKYNSTQTETLFKGYEGVNYSENENRVTIWTKYPITKVYKTYDKFTSVCVDIQTPDKTLTVYGTIIGVFANKQPKFNQDLEGQINDFKKIFPNKEVCIAGDLNIMFSGFAYPSHNARKRINEITAEFDLKNTTSEINENVDHIILSENLLKNKNTKIEIWNNDKKLSDHKGICLTID